MRVCTCVQADNRIATTISTGLFYLLYLSCFTQVARQLPRLDPIRNWNCRAVDFLWLRASNHRTIFETHHYFCSPESAKQSPILAKSKSKHATSRTDGLEMHKYRKEPFLHVFREVQRLHDGRLLWPHYMALIHQHLYNYFIRRPSAPRSGLKAFPVIPQYLQLQGLGIRS